MDEFKCLTKEHIYLIHQAAIETFGGSSGLFENTDGKIESILAQQYPFFGYDKYPTLLHKGAMLWYFFTKGHCFVDGNKRVGIQSAIVFLTINGYADNIQDREGYDKTMEICISHISEPLRDSYINSLAIWLSENFEKDDV